LAELEGRTAVLREARQDEHAITLIVETFRMEGGVRGELTLRRPDGAVTVRQVPGLDCREVQSAMALIAAVMVDPLAGGGEPGDETAEGTGTSDRTTSGAASASPEWSWRFEQRMTAHTAIAPRLSWGQALGLMLTSESWSGRPSLALSAHVAHATTSQSAGSAELEWLAGQLVVCPVSARPSQAWELRACATFQLGRLRGIGFQTFERATKAIVWSSAGLELEGRLRLIGPLWAGLEGGLIFPFSRERFYLEPGQDLHQVPAWGLGLGAGLGLQFF
jgi:hypothetical protein